MSFIRKATIDMTQDDWARFKRAWEKLNAQGRIDAYRRIHADYAEHTMQGMTMGFPGPSGNNLVFLFWHAQILLAFEAEMHEEEPDVCIPYWDCDKEPNGPSGLDGWLPEVNGGVEASWRPNRAWGSRSSKPSSSSINGPLNETDFSRFSARWESGYHNQVHNYVGGSMANMTYAPGDPLFWLHHCFIDYIWSLWKRNNNADYDFRLLGYKLRPWGNSCDDTLSNKDYEYWPPGGGGDKEEPKKPEPKKEPKKPEPKKEQPKPEPKKPEPKKPEPKKPEPKKPEPKKPEPKKEEKKDMSHMDGMDGMDMSHMDMDSSEDKKDDADDKDKRDDSKRTDEDDKHQSDDKDKRDDERRGDRYRRTDHRNHYDKYRRDHRDPRGGKDEHRGGKDEHRGGKDEHRGGKDEHRGGKDEHRGGSKAAEQDEHRGGSKAAEQDEHKICHCGRKWGHPRNYRFGPPPP